MNRLVSLICLFFLIGEQKGVADCCNSCFNWCDLSYSIYGDYLYWKVTKPETTRLQFANVTPPFDTVNFALSRYSSGYRVGAACFYHCFDFDVRYTSFSNSLHPVTLTTDVIGFAELTYHLKYETLDFAFGYSHYFLCDRAFVRPYAGTKLAWLNEHSVVTFLSLESSISNSSLKTRAYGLLLGAESQWQICRPISFIARGDLTVFNATTLFASSTISSTGPTPPVQYLHGLASFPFMADFFLGIGFDFCCFSCFAGNIQVGYEAQSWMNMREIRSFGSMGTLGLGGLVVHGNIIF